MTETHDPISALKSEIESMESDVKSISAKNIEAEKDIAVILSMLDTLEKKIDDVTDSSAQLSLGQLKQILIWFAAPVAVAATIFGTALWIVIADVAEGRADTQLQEARGEFEVALASFKGDFTASKVSFEDELDKIVARVEEEIRIQRELIARLRDDSSGLIYELEANKATSSQTVDEIEESNARARSLALSAESELGKIEQQVAASQALFDALSDTRGFAAAVAEDENFQKLVASVVSSRVEAVERRLLSLQSEVVKYSDHVRIGRGANYIRCRNAGRTELDCVWGGAGEDSVFTLTKR